MEERVETINEESSSSSLPSPQDNEENGEEENGEDRNEEKEKFLVANLSEIVITPGDADILAEGKGKVSKVEEKQRRRLLGWRRYLGVIYTMLSTNAFSLSSTVLKKYSHFHPFTIGVWSFPLAALFSVPFIIHAVYFKKQDITSTFWPITTNKKVAFIIWFRAMASVAVSYTIILAFKYISVADTRTIMSASVVTVYFFGWLFLGEKCGIVPIIVAILALCGIGVMTRPPILTGEEAFNENTLIGVSLALACLALVTIIVITLRYLQQVHHSMLNFILYVWAFGESLVLALAFDKFSIPSSLSDTLTIASVGLLLALGNLFLVLALQNEEAGVVALVRTLEVIFTFFWQFVILGKKPDGISIIGATFVITGVIIVTLRKWVGSLPEEDKRRKRLGCILY